MMRHRGFSGAALAALMLAASNASPARTRQYTPDEQRVADKRATQNERDQWNANVEAKKQAKRRRK